MTPNTLIHLIIKAIGDTVWYFAMISFHKTSDWKDSRICNIQTDQMLPDVICCLWAETVGFLCIEVPGMLYQLGS